MPTIVVESAFEFSEDTLHVKTFAPGEHDVTDECAAYAEKYGHVAKPGTTTKVKKSGEK